MACVQVLTAKCLGRRVCRDCGKNFNVADIMLPASNGQPEVRMPPLNPPENCRQKMEIRSDDNLETINNRIDVSSSLTLYVYIAWLNTVKVWYNMVSAVLNFVLVLTGQNRVWQTGLRL